MGKAIVITSGKGGVGKTTSSANIGCALALQGKSVVLVDADIGLRNLDVIMGLESRVVYDLIDVVEEVCRLSQALIRDKRFDHLYLLPAAQTRDKSAITPEQMQKVIHELKSQYDFVIIDCPAGIEQGYKNATSGAEEAIVVTVPEVSAVRDADRIIGLLSQEDFYSPKLIINRIRPDMVKKGDMMSVEDTLDILGVELLGIIPDDEYIIQGANLGQPVVTNAQSMSGAAYINIAKRILGQQIPLLAFEPQTGFWSRLKTKFGRK